MEKKDIEDFDNMSSITYTIESAPSNGGAPKYLIKNVIFTFEIFTGFFFYFFTFYKTVFNIELIFLKISSLHTTIESSICSSKRSLQALLDDTSNTFQSSAINGGNTQLFTANIHAFWIFASGANTLVASSVLATCEPIWLQDRAT